MTKPDFNEAVHSRNALLLKTIYPELPLLGSHQRILDFCQVINKRLSTMDERRYIRVADLKCIYDDFKDVFPPLMRFFIRMNFLRSIDGDFVEDDGIHQYYVINSRLDYDWALNLFSDQLELLATGIYKFDDVLKGGLRVFADRQRSLELGVKQLKGFRLLVQGRPGSGKTTMSLQMLSNFAAQGYTSVYLTAEQDLESLIRTLDRFSDVTKSGDSRNALFSFRALRTKDGPLSDRSRECSIWSNAVSTNNDDWAYHANKLKLPQEEKNPELEGYQPCGKEFWVAVPDLKDGDKFYFSNELAQQLVHEMNTKKRHGIIFVPFGVRPSDPHNLSSAQRKRPPLDRPRSQVGLTASEDGFLPHDAAEVCDYLNDLCGRPFETAQADESLTAFDTNEPRLLSLPFSWMVIDSSTAFARLTSRKEGLRLHRLLPHVALMMLSEHVSRAESPPTPQEASSDMTIELGERPLQITDTPESASNYMQRYLEVKKFRAAPFHRGKHPIAIKSHSLRVYRSIAILLKVTGNRRRSDPTTEESANQNHSEESAAQKQDGDSRCVRFGIDGLDEALSGGIQRGSVTVLSGPPGSNKAGLASYFLTEEFTRSNSASGRANASRSLIYSFSRDRRSILNGMSLYVWENGERILKESTDVGRILSNNLVIKDIKPGYLFPENFVEDLIDTLKEAKEEDKAGFTRVVFDSFDNVHAGFPLMRMDQFLWKVIFQVCWDYEVSALLKLAELDNASAYYKNMASLVTGMADNVIYVNHTGGLRVVGTETGGHIRELCKLSTVRYSPGGTVHEQWKKDFGVLTSVGQGDVEKSALKKLQDEIDSNLDAKKFTRDDRSGVYLDVRLPGAL